MFARLVLTFLAAGAVAAGAAVAEEPPVERKVDAGIVDGSAQKELDAARARWRKHGFRSYREEIDRSCFCPPDPPRVVRVGGGRLLRPVTADVREVATVPRQFRVVQQAIDERVSGLAVRYGRRGNPVSVGVDPSEFIADEESYYTMRRLQRLGR